MPSENPFPIATFEFGAFVKSFQSFEATKAIRKKFKTKASKKASKFHTKQRTIQDFF